MNWSALSEALDITTEMRPVYRAGKRGFLTKDAAIRDALKKFAQKIDTCDCGPAEYIDGRCVLDAYYCGCQHRTEEIIALLTPIAKRLPESTAEWEEKTSEEFWESYEFGIEEEEGK